MKSELIFSMGILIFSVLISGFSQILLKSAANSQHHSKLGEYLNAKVVIAYTIFLCSTLLTMLSLKVVPLSMAPVVESLNYIFVAIMSKVFLTEKIGKKKAVGLAIIMIGILVYSL